MNLDFFFSPQAVALVGASSKKGKVGNEILKSLLKTKARIYPVNPNEAMIENVKCYKSLTSIPEPIDLVVVSLAAKKIPSVINEAIQKNVRGMVIISGGFKEISKDGERLEYEIKEQARRSGMRIIGPNCIGVYSGTSQFDTFFQAREAMRRPSPGNISFITQSGTYGVTVLEFLEENGLGVSKFVSFGNKVDVNETDMLEYFLEDKETRIIAAYLEQIDNGRAFFNIVKKVSKHKPVIILKTGRTKLGNIAARSHTGAMAQNYEIFMGAMRQAGALVVDDIEEMIDIIKILALQPLPKNGNVMMITNGAGPCVVTADEIGLSKYLKLKHMDKQVKQSLSTILPWYAVISNPLDLTGSAPPAWYQTSIEFVSKDENLAIIILYFVVPNAPIFNNLENMLKMIENTKNINKTFICVMAGGAYTKMVEHKVQSLKVPVFTTARRVVNALDKVVEHSLWLVRHN